MRSSQIIAATSIALVALAIPAAAAQRGATCAETDASIFVCTDIDAGGSAGQGGATVAPRAGASAGMEESKYVTTAPLTPSGLPVISTTVSSFDTADSDLGDEFVDVGTTGLTTGIVARPYDIESDQELCAELDDRDPDECEGPSVPVPSKVKVAPSDGADDANLYYDGASYVAINCDPAVSLSKDNDSGVEPACVRLGNVRNLLQGQGS